MTVFVQHNNGTIRRVRGTFGGSSAWKQHQDCDCYGSDKHRRRRMVEQVETEIAEEQMRDAIARGSLSGSRQPQGISSLTRPQTRDTIEQSLGGMTMTSVPVKKASPIRRPFRVVKSETGKLVCVFLD